MHHIRGWKNCSFRRNMVPVGLFVHWNSSSWQCAQFPHSVHLRWSSCSRSRWSCLACKCPEHETPWDSQHANMEGNFYLLIQSVLNQQAQKKQTKPKQRKKAGPQTQQQQTGRQSVTEDTKRFIYNRQLNNQDVYYQGVNKDLVIPVIMS